MSDARANPFDITKASDFSDEQIQSTWVDGLGSQKFVDWAAPRSPMSAYILGGKGSGKTHLMRYLSFTLQSLRHGEQILAGIANEGYLGVYLRCSGLNAGRFAGKGQTPEVWGAVFAQYLDLWLAQLTLEAVGGAFKFADTLTPELEAEICRRIDKFLHRPEGDPPLTVPQLLEMLGGYQRRLDEAVNNAALSRELPVTIWSTPGELVFGLPRILHETLPDLRAVQVLYLIDEFENLTEAQQRYINTLIRERVGMCSLRVGGRTWGVRTYGTVSAEEENKKGSEYEVLYLDSAMREARQSYAIFCRRLLVRRLEASGHFPAGARFEDIEHALDRAFEVPVRGRFASGETAFVLRRHGERLYWKDLRADLHEALRRNVAWGLSGSADIDPIIATLEVPEYPLLEKMNVFLFYQEWSSKEDLLRAAAKVADECRAYVNAPKEVARYGTTLNHFRGDLIAQLRRQYEQRQRYLGLDTFIAMSSGLPRNLLIILKYVYQWAVYNGEMPFGEGAISEEAQRAGVLDASSWYYDDMRVRGHHGALAERAVLRLGELFRGIRYSDKPAECSLIAFSADTSQLRDETRQILDWAAAHALLIRIRRGQRDRNSERVDEKYQLNGMLCPQWDLPVARRGTLALSPTEVESIFGENENEAFERAFKERIDRMTAPMFGRAPAKFDEHPVLPGLDRD
jgi:hypothetical protein